MAGLYVFSPAPEGGLSPSPAPDGHSPNDTGGKGNAVTRKSACMGFAFFFCVATALLGLLAGFVPDWNRPQLHERINAAAVTTEKAAIRYDGDTGTESESSYQAAVSQEERGVAYAPGSAKTPKRPPDADTLFSRARRYRKLVEQFAERYRIDVDLIYAIIHNESNFQPGIISDKRAIGLMQILPDTAGDEVHRFLYGRPGVLTNEELIKPENKLRYGIVYLHLLLTRHFADVTDPKSREFCAIAAYNLGPNALLNSFARDRNEAVAAINNLTPQELYSRLSVDLPVRETRNFIARVLHSKKEFAEFQ